MSPVAQRFLSSCTTCEIRGGLAWALIPSSWRLLTAAPWHLSFQRSRCATSSPLPPQAAIFATYLREHGAQPSPPVRIRVLTEACASSGSSLVAMGWSCFVAGLRMGQSQHQRAWWQPIILRVAAALALRFDADSMRGEDNLFSGSVVDQSHGIIMCMEALSFTFHEALGATRLHGILPTDLGAAGVLIRQHEKGQSS